MPRSTVSTPAYCEYGPAAQSHQQRKDPYVAHPSDNSENIEVQASRECPVSPKEPPFVTFKTGAQLLIDEGLVESITPDGLRYIARNAKDWPFGDEPGRHPYVMVGNARTMETGVFLTYFRSGPSRGGRGPNKK